MMVLYPFYSCLETWRATCLVFFMGTLNNPKYLSEIAVVDTVVARMLSQAGYELHARFFDRAHLWCGSY